MPVNWINGSVWTISRWLPTTWNTKKKAIRDNGRNIAARTNQDGEFLIPITQTKIALFGRDAANKKNSFFSHSVVNKMRSSEESEEIIHLTLHKSIQMQISRFSITTTTLILSDSCLLCFLVASNAKFHPPHVDIPQKDYLLHQFEKVQKWRQKQNKKETDLKESM